MSFPTTTSGSSGWKRRREERARSTDPHWSESKIATDAARKLSVCLLGLGQVSRLLESLTRLEQVGCQVGPADVDAEALDQARAFDDGAAGFPKRTALTRTRLRLTLSD